MSDVLIRNMKLPENCDDCEYEFACGYGQHIDGYKMLKGRPERCPFIILPPHGRLIDADALNYKMLYKENWMRGTGVEAPAVWKKDIEDAPTIIPAEEANGCD